jgi:archaemetzincin
MARKDSEASSNGRTADFGSAYEGSNPSASTSAPGPARPASRAANHRAEVKALPLPGRFLLVPIGPLPRGTIPGISAALQEIFGPPSELVPPQVKPDFAFNKDRRQYHSTAVLRRLEGLRHRGSDEPVLGVVDVDLFVPDQPYVFGESDRDARSALVSVFRLKGSEDHPVTPERLAHRARVEAAHATGHLLGLSHCGDLRCIMFLAHTPADSDRKGDGLCGACRSAIGRP